MFKKQTGITLIALVITIIVLLILAGVTISLVIGDNGVLTQASTSVVETKIADAREDLNVALAATETIYYGKWVDNTSTLREDVYFGTENVLSAQLANLGYTLSAGLENKLIVGPDEDGNVDETGVTVTLTSEDTEETIEFSNVFVNANSGKAKMTGSITLKDKAGRPLYTLELTPAE